MVPQVAPVVDRGEFGVGEADAAECREQDVGHRGEPEAQLVRAQCLGAGPATPRSGLRGVGEEVELALLDPVLHCGAAAQRSDLRRRRGHEAAAVSRGRSRAARREVGPRTHAP